MTGTKNYHPDEKTLGILKSRIDAKNLDKLLELKNELLHRFVAEAIDRCRPDSVFVCTDAPEDLAYVRRMAVERGEEKPLKVEGHTIHFDGFKTATENDQGRDKDATKYLVPRGVVFSNRLNHVAKDEGLADIRKQLTGIMRGKQAIIRFFCLGPTNSPFSISCAQITDSFYVGHSEDLLYRQGYEQFKKLGNSTGFFRFLHSAGELDERGISKNSDRRAVRIDLEENTVYSVNTQYAGNTVGLKKLALRLAINKASREGWLAEHMLLMGINGKGGRVTYFSGAFPSACGKTSTAMLPGERIVGDDLAYLRNFDGVCRAANVEAGIFGIIADVNAQSDPLIWKVLTSPGEVIFSNVLVKDGTPYWLNDGRPVPESGDNFAGHWVKGMVDANDVEIPHAHKNARYTISLHYLENKDPELDNPQGVPLGGVVYGGRDSDTCVPVEEAFDWAHGVITKGATIESETTAATLGKEGVRAFCLMSNIDFLSMPLGRYIRKHLEFGAALKQAPRIFSVNYFLKGVNGKYLNGMLDKKVWMHWAERRVHGEVDAIRTPTGWYPKYEDLRQLFQECLGREYTREAYVEQFSIRTTKLIEKIDRIEKIYRGEVDVPDVLYKTLDEQRQRLQALRAAKGDVVSPLDL
jgi:phosphoenolpyruvate carboxykinase (GTP)